jgi:hypothetical protein
VPPPLRYFTFLLLFKDALKLFMLRCALFSWNLILWGEARIIQLGEMVNEIEILLFLNRVFGSREPARN